MNTLSNLVLAQVLFTIACLRGVAYTASAAKLLAV